MKHKVSYFSLGLPVFGDCFFGRRKEFSEIFSLLRAGSAVNFYSLRRMGKSSLLRQIDYLCENDTDWKHYQPVFLDMMSAPGESLADHLLWRLGIKTIKRLRADNAWREVERHVQRNTGRSILLIDELNYGFRQGIHEHDFAHLRALQQAGVLNIVASTLYGSIMDHLQHLDMTGGSPFFNIFHIFRLPSFLPEEAEELLITLCDRGGVVLDPDLAKELARYVGYYPSLVQEIGHVAFQHLSDGGKVSIEEIASEWQEWSGRQWAAMILRLFQEESVGTSTKVGGMSREKFLMESLEDYGILLRDEIGNLIIAPYIRDLLKEEIFAEQALDRLQALADLGNRDKRQKRLQGDKGQGTPMISILFLAAEPADAARLRLGEELREIQLQLARPRTLFKLEPRMSVRPTDISQAMLDVQPQIVHFCGHGTATGMLCFENQVGETHPIQPDALAALFEQFAHQVNCVLLNACYSEAQAKAIAKHIEYVIGMNQAIGDRAAIAFAVGFYQALGAGRTVEDAYKLGCVQIRLQGIPEHLTPVLIKRGAIQS